MGVGRAAGAGLTGGLLLVGGAACRAPLESFNPVTPRGAAIADYFTLVWVPSFLIFALVVGALAYILVRYRDRGRPGDPEPRQIHGHTRLEIAWTIAPILLLALLFVLAFQTMRTVEAEAPPDALEVRVIGHQWWWEYQYPALGIVTANELHVPVGRPVRLVVTSADVIHSFWLPRLGWMKDAIPGKTNDIQAQFVEAGVYDGVCTEYCGTQHAWMRVWAVADPPEQFEAWVRRQQQPATTPPNELLQRGQAVFLSNTCVNCHAITGTPADARVGPDLTHFGSRAIIGAGVIPNTPENLRSWLLAIQAIKPGALMPGYPNLGEDDLTALVAYLESLE